MKLIRFAHLSGAGTTVVTQNGRGGLWTVNVNTAANATTCTLYDGQSAAGIVIAVIDCSALQSKMYAVSYMSGITAVIAGGSTDITIGYE